MNMLRVVVSCTCLCVLSAIPFAAEAKVRTLWPIDFKVVAHTSTPLSEKMSQALQDFHRLSSVAHTGVSFEHPVKFPLGARIKKIAVGAQTSLGGSAGCDLRRIRDNLTVISLSDFEVLLHAAATGHVVAPKDWYIDDTVEPPEAATAVAGYRYWVRCTVMNTSDGMDASEIYRVKIFYR